MFAYGIAVEFQIRITDDAVYSIRDVRNVVKFNFIELKHRDWFD